MPQEQSNFEQLIYETLVSVVESEGVTLTDAEKEYLAETAKDVIVASEASEASLVEQLEVLVSIDESILKGENFQELDASIPPEIDRERLKMILDKIKRHREAFVEIDKIRENEQVMREGGPKGSSRN